MGAEAELVAFNDSCFNDYSRLLSAPTRANTAKCKVKQLYVFNGLVLPYNHLITIFIQVVNLMTNCLVQAYFVITLYLSVFFSLATFPLVCPK